MKIIFILISILLYSQSVVALSLSEFVPSFLQRSESKEYDARDAAVKPFVSVKRNTSSGSSWYCTRMQNSVSNVFCEHESANVAKKIVYGNHNNDNTVVVDSSNTSNSAITQNMNERTATFQDPKVTNMLLKDQDQIQNSALIPLQPSENVKMNVNAQQIQFNIKY